MDASTTVSTHLRDSWFCRLRGQSCRNRKVKWLIRCLKLTPSCWPKLLVYHLSTYFYRRLVWLGPMSNFQGSWIIGPESLAYASSRLSCWPHVCAWAILKEMPWIAEYKRACSKEHFNHNVDARWDHFVKKTNGGIFCFYGGDVANKHLDQVCYDHDVGIRHLWSSCWRGGLEQLRRSEQVLKGRGKWKGVKMKHSKDQKGASVHICEFYILMLKSSPITSCWWWHGMHVTRLLRICTCIACSSGQERHDGQHRPLWYGLC